jgi:UDP-N-acetylmuramate--alanine ligase
VKQGSHVHFIGIGGSGLSAIARVMLESGYSVSGSDRQASPLALSLQSAGAQVFLGHRPENVSGADLVIRSSAVQEDNVEVQAARLAGIPVMKRADILDELMSGKLGITVAGTHGKTTTTAMIAWMLTALGQDPTFIIGGVSLNLGTNARAGKGKAFVIEADEYDRMFLGLHPKVAVITNIEHDHPDCYPTPESYYQAFLEFAGQVDSDGAKVICKDDLGASRLLAETHAQGRAYAYSVQDAQCAGYASRVKPNSMGGFSFDAVLSGSGQPAHVPVTLTVPGVHNVLNALAAFLVADWLGLPLQGVAKALEE